MISKSSYSTTFGNIFPTQKHETAIKEALIAGSLNQRKMGVAEVDGVRSVFVTGLDSAEDKIPPFIHPIHIKGFKGYDYVVSDIRAFRSNKSPWQSDREFENAIRNKSDYAIIKTRSILEAMWEAGKQSEIRPQFKFAGNVYAAWLAQAIARVYALDFHDQYRIMIIAVYFYHTRFVDQPRLEGQLLDIACNHCIKMANGVSAAEIYTIFEKLPDMNNADDFCTAIRESLENIRLNDFNLGVLLGGIRNSFFGDNAKDLLNVSLEYPPVWISIVSSVLMEKSFKRSPLYTTIEQQGKRGGIDEFKSNYLSLIRQRTVALESAITDTESAADLYDIVEKALA